MTHDELLAKIKGSSPHWLALRAVVELHSKPGYHHANVCDVCDAIHPCPTIQAIEKELT